jgi:hypothetical protein
VGKVLDRVSLECRCGGGLYFLSAKPPEACPVSGGRHHGPGRPLCQKRTLASRRKADLKWVRPWAASDPPGTSARLEPRFVVRPSNHPGQIEPDLIDCARVCDFEATGDFAHDGAGGLPPSGVV